MSTDEFVCERATARELSGRDSVVGQGLDEAEVGALLGELSYVVLHQPGQVVPALIERVGRFGRQRRKRRVNRHHLTVSFETPKDCAR